MDLVSLTPLEGGWSGETFLGEALDDKVVVRIYAGRGASRGERAPETDAAVLRLVRGLVEVPRVVETRQADPRSGSPGLLVASFVEGLRGDLALNPPDEARHRVLGAGLGAVAAALAAMPMLRAGSFADPDLGLVDLPGPDTLVAWAAERCTRWPGWDDERRAGLLAVADEADTLLAEVERRCLVHGDLNAKNVLVDPDSLAIRAVVDWEFAHAGHPFTDLGNLLRWDRSPAYVEAVLAAWGERHCGPPERAVALARAADLWSLVDLADRSWAESGNPVAARAARLVAEIAARRDLSAWPDEWA